MSTSHTYSINNDFTSAGGVVIPDQLLYILNATFPTHSFGIEINGDIDLDDGDILIIYVGDTLNAGELVTLANLVATYENNYGSFINTSFTGAAIISDVKATGTNGGTFTSGSWQTRTLNTLESYGPSFVTLSSNQFTLIPGTYQLSGYAPAKNVGNHQCQIYNITNSTIAIIGRSVYSTDTSGIMKGIGGGSSTNSEFSGIITISSNKIYELRHRSSATQTNTGFGTASGFTTETYSVLNILKLA